MRFGKSNQFVSGITNSKHGLRFDRCVARDGATHFFQVT
jgi:hypothetical protein